MSESPSLTYMPLNPSSSSLSQRETFGRLLVKLSAVAFKHLSTPSTHLWNPQGPNGNRCLSCNKAAASSPWQLPSAHASGSATAAVPAKARQAMRRNAIVREGQTLARGGDDRRTPAKRRKCKDGFGPE